MKCSPKCKTKILGIIYTLFWELFTPFLIGKGPIFGSKSGLGISLITGFDQCILSVTKKVDKGLNTCLQQISLPSIDALDIFRQKCF